MFDGDPTASWALIDIDGASVETEIRRTVFDTMAVSDALSARGLPGDGGRQMHGGRIRRLAGQESPQGRRRLLGAAAMQKPGRTLGHGEAQHSHDRGGEDRSRVQSAGRGWGRSLPSYRRSS